MRKLLLLIVVFGTGASEGISKSEFECWQAVQRLIDCCPEQYRTTIDSVVCSIPRGCGHSSPSLSVEQSQCIENQACKDLIANDFCNLPTQVCQ